MATMADVAQRAGVSVSTVSHVINGTRIVREETRRAVLAAIEDIGYTHNTITRSLITTSTQVIGLAISVISNLHWIVPPIERAMSSAGYTLITVETRDEVEQELKVVKALQQRRVDGIFLAPTVSDQNPTIRYLLQLGVPTVLVDRCTSYEFDRVGTENTNAIARLVTHLAELGHERIGMISGHPAVLTTRERVKGYVAGLQRLGLPHDPAIVKCGNSNADDAEIAVYRLLASRDRPTALVVGNNHMTIGALRALERRKIRIPDDTALVSFDDLELADLMSPRLTTMAQPIEKIGQEAARLMLTRLANPTQGAREVRLSPKFMDRESCGCAKT